MLCAKKVDLSHQTPFHCGCGCLGTRLWNAEAIAKGRWREEGRIYYNSMDDVMDCLFNLISYVISYYKLCIAKCFIV